MDCQSAGIKREFLNHDCFEFMIQNIIPEKKMNLQEETEVTENK